MDLSEATAAKKLALKEKDYAIKYAVKVAEKEAKAKERERYSKIVDKEKQKNLTLKGIIDEQKLHVSIGLFLLR